jgi:hypothetical protein
MAEAEDRAMNIEEIVELMQQVRESGMIGEIAKTLFALNKELQIAGFTEEQAMQIIIQHGTSMGLTK